MKNISSILDLKSAIQLMELNQKAKQQLLIEQFKITVSGFKPANILKNKLTDAVSSPVLIDQLLGTAIGLLSGYFSKKILVGTSSRVLQNMVGSAIQAVVTGVIARHYPKIKSIGSFIVQAITHKKKLI